MSTEKKYHIDYARNNTIENMVKDGNYDLAIIIIESLDWVGDINKETALKYVNYIIIKDKQEKRKQKIERILKNER